MIHTRVLKIIRAFQKLAGSWTKNTEESYGYDLPVKDDVIHIMANKLGASWELAFDSDSARKSEDRWMATGKGEYSIFVHIFKIFKEFVEEHDVTKLLIQADYKRLIPIYDRLIRSTFPGSTINTQEEGETTSFHIILKKE